MSVVSWGIQKQCQKNCLFESDKNLLKFHEPPVIPKEIGNIWNTYGWEKNKAWFVLSIPFVFNLCLIIRKMSPALNPKLVGIQKRKTAKRKE